MICRDSICKANWIFASRYLLACNFIHHNSYCLTFRFLFVIRAAEIKDIIHVTREEPFPRYYENTDFSVETVKNSIKDSELKANEILEKRH